MFFCLLLKQFVCVFKLGEFVPLKGFLNFKKLRYVRIRDGGILTIEEHWELSRQIGKIVNGHLCREF
jgi:hypothetical protein